MHKKINSYFENFCIGQLLKNESDTEIIYMLRESYRAKYKPALVQSVLLATIMSFGLYTLPDSTLSFIFLGNLIMTTGVAWFSISLKDIPHKHFIFGNSLTKQLLITFFTSTLVLLFIFTIKIIEQINFGGFFGSGLIQVMTIIAAFIIVIKLFQATIQFDGADALQTGTTAKANEFFIQNTDEFEQNIQELRATTSSTQANLVIIQILLGLGVLRLGLADQMEIAQKEVGKFDTLIIPLVLEYFQEKSSPLYTESQKAWEYLQKMQKEEEEEVYVPISNYWYINTIQKYKNFAEK